MFTHSLKDNSSFLQLGPYFVLLPIVSIGDDNIVLTKLMAALKYFMMKEKHSTLNTCLSSGIHTMLFGE